MSLSGWPKTAKGEKQITKKNKWNYDDRSSNEIRVLKLLTKTRTTRLPSQTCEHLNKRTVKIVSSQTGTPAT